jgi:hypothetical protein
MSLKSMNNLKLLIMKTRKTLRDELAMSMTTDLIPEIIDEKTDLMFSEKYGLEWSDDPITQIEWAINYQAIIRYMYADAMLKARGEDANEGSERELVRCEFCPSKRLNEDMIARDHTIEVLKGRIDRLTNELSNKKNAEK